MGEWPASLLNVKSNRRCDESSFFIDMIDGFLLLRFCFVARLLASASPGGSLEEVVVVAVAVLAGRVRVGESTDATGGVWKWLSSASSLS